ncbi:MAG: hypothetical protein KKC77_19225 [Proteobacteria bacterium]|nr:hypothetical protein [Pseudomonadota bacterium]
MRNQINKYGLQTIAIIATLIAIIISQGCATAKLPKGVSAQLYPQDLKCVINVPPDWPDLTKYEYYYETFKADGYPDIAFIHYMDVDEYIDYVFTALVDKCTIIAGEIIHKAGLFHFYWIYENNTPHPKSCSEDELMERLEIILENENAGKGKSI